MTTTQKGHPDRPGSGGVGGGKDHKPGGHSDHDYEKARHAARQLRRKDKSPCNRPPLEPTGLRLFFKAHEALQEQRGTARVRWNEVTQDTTGFPVDIDNYDVMLVACNSTGNPLDTDAELPTHNITNATASGGIATFTISDTHQYDQGDVVQVTGVSPAGYNGYWAVTGTPTNAKFTANIGVNPANGSGGTAQRQTGMRIRRHVKAQPQRYFITAATAAASIATFTTRQPHHFSNGDLVVVWNVTPSAYVGIWKVASTPTATTFTANIGSSPANATKFGQVWDADDGQMQIITHDLPRPKTWWWKARVRAHSVDGCWSSWTDWCTPQLPALGPIPLPPAPTYGGTPITFDTKGKGRHDKLRLLFTFNEVQNFDYPNLGAEHQDDVDSYIVQMDRSDDGVTWDGPPAVHTHHQAAKDNDADSTRVAVFHDRIRRRYWYRCRVRCVDRYNRRSDWSAWTPAALPFDDNTPPAPTNVETWDPQTDRVAVGWDDPVINVPIRGTASVTNGAATVTGTGTKWQTELREGSVISFSNAPTTYYTVQAVATDTALTLMSAYAEVTNGSRSMFVADDDPDVAFYEVQIAKNSQVNTGTTPYTWTGVYAKTRVRGTRVSFKVPDSDKTNRFHARVRSVDAAHNRSGWVAAWVRANHGGLANNSTATAGDTGAIVTPIGGDGVIAANPATVHAEGTIGAIRVWWDETATVQADPTTYDVFLGTTSGFTPSGTNQVGSTLGFQMLIVRNPDNTALALGTNYYVKVRARDLYDGVQTGSTAATENPVQVAKQASDGAVPAPAAGVPAASVLPGGQGLKVSWPAVTNNDPVVYEVHVSTNPAFNPTAGDSTTLFGVYDATNAFVNKLPPNPPGTDLIPGTTYYVRIFARDFDGPQATPGTVGSAKVQETPSDGLVPLATTPVVELQPGIGWIRAKWTPVPIGVRTAGNPPTGKNPDLCGYDVYVKDGSAPTGVASELVATDVRADYCYVRSADSSGTPLQYDHTYYVGVKVRDADGVAASLGATLSGRVTQVTNGDIAVNAVSAGQIQAGSIDASKLSGEVVLGTKAIVGGPSNAKGVSRVVMNQDGITFFKGDGTNDTAVIQMKTSDGSAKFTGDVAATTLSAPGATFDGLVNITKNGSISLASVQTAPTTPPVLSQDYQGANFPPDDFATIWDAVSTRSSPWFDGTDYWYVQYALGSGLGDGHFLVRVNAAGTITSRTFFHADGSRNYVYWGMVKKGSFWYALANKISGANQGPKWFVYADASGVPGTLQNTNDFVEFRGQYQAALATDGANLYVAQSNNTGPGGTNQLWAATYTSAGAAVPTISGTRVLSDTSGARWAHHVLSLYVGNGDFGSVRWVVTMNTVQTAYVLTYVASTSLTENTASNWPLPGTPTGTAKDLGAMGGVTYIGTSFAQFADLVTGGMYLFTQLASATYYVAYSWLDFAGTQHETQIGPFATITMNARARMIVSWPPIPTGGAEDPNRVRIYMNDALPGTPTNLTSYFQQGSQFSTTSTTFTSYSEAVPGSKQIDFVGAGAGGTLVSSSGGFSLSGTGLLVLPNGASNPPVTGTEGSVYYDSTDDAMYVHNGTAYRPAQSFVGGHTEKAANQAGIAQAAQTVVTFPAASYQSHTTLWDSTNFRWVIPTGFAGIWRFLCVIQWDIPLTNHVDKSLRLNKNIAGTSVIVARIQFTTGGTVNAQTCQVLAVCQMAAGDTMSAEATSGSATVGADQRLLGDATGKTYFQAEYLGPIASF